MEGPEAGGSVFMCRLCNLFSPSRSQLQDHCSQLHPQQQPPDDIIILLQPLTAEPVEKLAEGPVKRKRGRPKGSTKKMRTDLTEGKIISSHGPEAKSAKEQKRNKDKGERQISTVEGKSHKDISGLQCRSCHRSFSNRRQILKHICLREEDEEEDEEENGTIFGEAEGEGSENLDPEGADPNQNKQTLVRPGRRRQKDVGNFRSQRTKRSRISKEGSQATGNRKSVVSVVLTEDETLPGVTKMVPVVDSPAETESAAAQPQRSAVVQSESQDLTNETAACDEDPKTDQEPSSTPTTETSKGFQEYSIQQDAANLLQSQLKIFACEFCNKIFKFRHSLIAHLRTHTQEKPFQCPHCDYASAIKANLNVHLRKHTGEKFSCDQCSFTCLSPGHLKVHIERVHMKVKQHCSFCDKKYSDVKNLLKHMEKRHNLKDAEVRQSYQQLRLKTRQGLRQLLYHCPTCNRRFKNHLERERHLLVHGPQRPFACLLCDHAATKMAALAAHVRKHLFLYVCCSCDDKFVSSQRLKTHLKEAHPELDQNQAFTDSINNSFYLVQPGGGMWGNEDDMETEEKPDQRTEQEDGDEGVRQEGEDEGVRQEGEDDRVRPEEGRNEGEQLNDSRKEDKPQNQSAEEVEVMAAALGSSDRPDGAATGSSDRPDEAATGSSDRPDEAATGSSDRPDEAATGPDEAATGPDEAATGSSDRPDGAATGSSDRPDEAATGSSDRPDEAATGSSDRPDEAATGSLDRPDEAATGSSDRLDEAADGEKSHEETTETSSSERLEEKTLDSASPKILSSALEDRTLEEAQTAAENTPSSSASLSGHVNLTESSGPLVDESGRSEKASEDFHQSSFQQVFLSLQKTQLNMETFQRLRKIYGELECQYCGKLFWYKVHYNGHIRTHTKEHSHYCSKCSYSSITKSSLKRHQIQKHSGLQLPCSNPGCKYTTPDKYKLQAHLRTHQEQGRSAACPVCQHSYPEHRLKNHIKKSHPDALPAQGKGLMVQRAEKCPYCDSYFLKNSSDFQQHIWAHQGLKPYLCSLCDYAGRSRSNLKTHMNRHNTERRHLCDLCGKKFKSKVTLKSHRLSHTDEGKRFQCSECDFTSVSKPSLLRHMEQHADFKPFRCALCHYSCNITGALKRHYHVKHPDQKYENAGPGLPNPDALKQQGGMKCPECEFVYGTKWELNRHLKSKHSMKVVEGTWEVAEEVEAQYVSVEDEEHLTEAPLAALQDNVNIQQITEFTSETQDAVASMVAMAPGTVTVVQQVTDDQDVGSNQLMVLDAEGGLNGDQVMVVEDGHGLEALTVLTQGENAHHYIVYVQEHTVEIN